MTYLALARKWRPKVFSEVMGQSHVVKALTNALTSGRVHHAFLFTGTRGVGKTTLARIFAKSLNCEQGMSATPCGVCSVCQSVDRGSYIDLIEVDAASRTGIDDMRELLDNVQYAPTQGQYKVYLIDEVHMLSKSSFNALLKTLEEPPEHVKFLFATTDPQKLPVTVLSRCLQFNLKALQPDEIVQQMKQILSAEAIEYDDIGLNLIGRAAEGSLRDGLSLLEQAIAQGGGAISEESVRSMLGTVKAQHMHQLLLAIVANNVHTAMETINEMSTYAADFSIAIDQLLVELHYVALAQIAPQSLQYKVTDVEKYQNIVEKISAEDIQLCYQIALMGKRDIALAPDYRSGFEMVLLRIMAFKPSNDIALEGESTDGGLAVSKSENKPTTLQSPQATASTQKSLGDIAKPMKSINNQEESLNKASLAVPDVVGLDDKHESMPVLPTRSQVDSIVFDDNGRQAPNLSADSHQYAPEELTQGGEQSGRAENNDIDQSDAESLQSKHAVKLNKPVVAGVAVSDNNIPSDESVEQYNNEEVGRPSFRAAPNFASSSNTQKPSVQTSRTFEQPLTSEIQQDRQNPPTMAQNNQFIEPPVLDQRIIHTDPPISSESLDEDDDPSQGLPIASMSEWAGFVQQLSLNGLVRELAMNMACPDINVEPILLYLDPNFQYMHNPAREATIIQEIGKLRGAQSQVKIIIESSVHETPAERIKRLSDEKLRNTKQQLREDPTVQSVMNTLGMSLDESSVKPK